MCSLIRYTKRVCDQKKNEEKLMDAHQRRSLWSAYWVLLALLWMFAACGDSSNNTNHEQTTSEKTTTPDGGSTAEKNNNTDTSKPPAPITALAADEFVYVHYPKNDGVGHIKIYDLKTKTARLVTDLDNKTKTPSVSLSPDRKWIAFRASLRPNAEDLKQGITIPAYWVVSVDGKQLRRVTETIPNSNNTNATCQSDVECATTGYCNTALGRCSLRNYSIGLGRPAWSADGKTLWGVLSTHWSEGTRLTGGSSLFDVPVSGGIINIHTNTSGCAQVTHISTHPTQNKLVSVHSVCTSGKPGLHMYDLPPKQSTQVFSNPNISAELNTTAWLPDGSGVLFVTSTTWDLDNDGKADTSGIGIAGYDLNTKQFSAILPPLKTGTFYSNFTVAPDAKRLLVCIYDSTNNRSDIYVLDTTNQAEPFKALIEDGKSCDPSWR